MSTTSVHNHTETRERVNNRGFALPKALRIDWKEAQYNYYAIIVFTLIIGSCIGGIAAATILHSPGSNMVQLSACAAVSMFNNTTAIGGMPVKWVAGSFALSLVVNIALIIINIF